VTSTTTERIKICASNAVYAKRRGQLHGDVAQSREIFNGGRAADVTAPSFARESRSAYATRLHRRSADQLFKIAVSVEARCDKRLQKRRFSARPPRLPLRFPPTRLPLRNSQPTSALRTDMANQTHLLWTKPRLQARRGGRSAPRTPFRTARRIQRSTERMTVAITGSSTVHNERTTRLRGRRVSYSFNYDVLRKQCKEANVVLLKRSVPAGHRLRDQDVNTFAAPVARDSARYQRFSCRARWQAHATTYPPFNGALRRRAD